MSVDRIAAALILANRHQVDGITVEDFDLSSYEGVAELAKRAIKIKYALEEVEANLKSRILSTGEHDELGSILSEPSND